MNRTIPSCVLFMAAGGILSAQSIAFDSAPAYMAPSSAFAVGDFNKDAKPDIASGVYTIVLLNGRGDGTFGAPTQISPLNGDAPVVSMVVGDFNGDTNPDIAALYLSPSGFVAILIGNGNGTFQPAANYAVGARAGVLVAEDFTGDQITDLVTGNYDAGISFLRGNSDGTFLPALNSQSFPVRAMAAGVLNGDSLPDLVAIDSTTGRPRTLLGDGNGNFMAGPPLAPQGPRRIVHDVTVGDVNNDSKQDMVVLEGDSRWIREAAVYLGNGDGTFQGRLFAAVLGNPEQAGLSAPDLNGDGRRDIVIAYHSAFSTFPELKVLLGNGDATFSGEHWAGGRGGIDVRTADLNGDSIPDVVLGARGSKLLRARLGRGDGTFQEPEAAFPFPLDFSKRYSAAVTADFDGDGHQDVAATADAADCGIVVVPGNGDGTFRAPVSTLTEELGCGNVRNLLVEDFNGDQIPDLASLAIGRVLVMTGKGDGSFQQPKSRTLPNSAYGDTTNRLVAGDFDGDSIPDLAAAVALSGYSPGGIAMMSGIGDGTFRTPEYVGGVYNPGSLRAADINGDSKPDLAATNTSAEGTSFISVLLNAGNGLFSTSYVPMPDGWSLRGLAAGDLNADSSGDLVVSAALLTPAGYTQAGIAVLLGHADGTFHISAYHRADFLYPRFNSISRPYVSDLDNDQRLDVVISDDTHSDFQVLKGRGDGTLLPSAIFTGVPVERADEFHPIAAADFNGDSKPDLLLKSEFQFYPLMNLTE